MSPAAGSNGASLPGGPAGGTGTYGLASKDVGQAAPPDGNQYGTWSGSISESSFTANYAGKAPYEATASFKAGWSAPPSVLKPGDIIELTCTASAALDGKDKPNAALTALWDGTGQCTRVEGSNAFAGVASSGKLYSSGSGKFRFKVGDGGGTITLTSARSGIAWGSGGKWTPCTYTYEWNAPPKVKPGGDEAAAGGDDSTDDGTLGTSNPATTMPATQSNMELMAWLDPERIVLYPGEPSRIVDVHIKGYRRNTDDRALYPETESAQRPRDDATAMAAFMRNRTDNRPFLSQTPAC